MTSTSKNYFEELPPEIFVEILTYFSDSTLFELKRISMVCKHWKNIIEHEFGLTDRTVFIVDRLTEADVKECLELATRNFKRFELTCDYPPCAPIWRIAREVFSKFQVKSLVLKGRGSHSHGKVLEVLELTSKSLVDSKIDPFLSLSSKHSQIVIETLSFPKIKSLEGSANNIGYLNCLEDIQTLTSLTFHQKNVCSTAMLKMLIDSNRKTIEKLRITVSANPSDNEMFAFIKNLPKLVSLELTNENKTNIQRFNDFVGLEAIEHLKIDAFLIPKDKMSSLNEMLPKLMKLDLSMRHNEQQSGDPFSYINVPIPHLTSLEVHDHRPIEVMPNINFSPTLTSLSLHIEQFTKNLAELLIVKFPSIKSFEVCSALPNHKFSDAISVIASGWRNLICLKMNEIANEYAMQQSYEFHWDFAPVDNKIIFPKLKDLSVKKCRNLNTLFNSVSIPQLLHLSLEDCCNGPGNINLENTNFERLKTLEIKGDVFGEVVYLNSDFKNLEKLRVCLEKDALLRLLARIKSKSFIGEIELSRRGKNQNPCTYLAEHFVLKTLKWDKENFKLYNELISIDVKKS